MKKLLVVAGIATFFFCGLFVSTVLAESKVSQFADPNYSFASLRVVAVDPIQVGKTTGDPYGKQKAEIAFKQGLTKFPFELIWLDQPITQGVLNSGAYQAVMQIDVKSLGWDTQVIPGHYEQNYDPVMIGNWGWGGWGGWGGYATVPVIDYVPPTVEKNASVSVEMQMTDVETGKIIWGYSEERYDDGGAFGSPSPDKSLQTIINNASKSLKKAVSMSSPHK